MDRLAGFTRHRRRTVTLVHLYHIEFSIASVFMWVKQDADSGSNSDADSHLSCDGELVVRRACLVSKMGSINFEAE